MVASSQAIKAGRAYVELGLKDAALLRGLRRASARLNAFAGSLRSLGIGMAATGAGLLTPLLAASKVAADIGGDLLDMSQRTGASVEALSELGFAAEQSGTNMATLEGSLLKMQRFLVMAAEGGKQAHTALARLGLSASDLAQLAPEEQFARIAEAISQIEDPAIRTAMAMRIFGRSGTKLLPLMQGGAQGIEELRKRARELGLTMSTEDAQAAEAFGDSMDALWTVLKRSVAVIGSALVPILDVFVQSVTRGVARVMRFIQANRQLLQLTAVVGVGLVAAGTAFIGLAVAMKVAAVALGALATGLGVLLSPMVALGSVTVAFGGYLLYASGVGQQALQWLGDAFGVLLKRATATWQAIGNALASGNIAAAAKVLWAYLKMEWQRGVHALTSLWQAGKTAFLESIQEMTFAAARIFIEGTAGLEAGWKHTVGFLQDAWALFTNFVSSTWHRTVGFIQKAWVRLKKLFDEDIDVDAEVARINRDVESRTSANRDEMLKGIRDREVQRDSQLQNIERDRKGALAALKQQQATYGDDLRKKQSEALARSQGELDRARAAWKSAVAEVPVSPPSSYRQEDLLAQLRASMGGLDAVDEKIAALGTFNPFEAAGFGGNNLPQRAVKATEAIDKKMGQLLNQARQGGLVFP